MEQFIDKIYIFKRFACVFLLGIKCDTSGFMAHKWYSENMELLLEEEQTRQFYSEAQTE